MDSLTRVLAATDLSSPSRHAAERAAMIARQTGAAFELIHVLDPTALARLPRLLGQAPAELEARLLAHARAQTERQAAPLRERHGVCPAVRVATGALLAELRARTQDAAAGLVVLGARGQSFMRHALLGSTPTRLLGTLQVPMLVVKQVPRERYRTVLVPVDFSAASPAALRIARAVAPGAEIVLLNAYEVPFEPQLQFANVDDETIRRYRPAARQDALERMHALCAAAGLASGAVRTLVLHGDAARRIVEQEQELDCDLIVVGRRGESALEHLLVGSVTRRVLAEAQGDVLVPA